MSEDKHFPPPAPLPEPLQDHEPTDKPAAKGIWFAVLTVFVVSMIAFAIIYGRTHGPDAQREQAPTEQAY